MESLWQERLISLQRQDQKMVMQQRESIKFTVSDTGEVQKVRMKDDTIKVEVLKTDKKNKKKVPRMPSLHLSLMARK